MQSILRHVRQPALLAAIAFVALWAMTNRFDDNFARLVLGMAFASYVAVGSGISGFILAQIEGQDGR